MDEQLKRPILSPFPGSATDARSRPRRRITVAVVAIVASVSVGVVAYVLAQLRTCDEVSRVSRGSYQYRLCNVGKELIGKVPVVTPADEPRFSWRYADGMKPGRWRLQYQSRSVPADVRATMQAMLASAGFSPLRGEAMRNELGRGYEWWFDGNSAVGLSLTPGANGAGTEVDLLHNTGHD